MILANPTVTTYPI